MMGDYAMNSYPPEGRAWINEEKGYLHTMQAAREDAGASSQEATRDGASPARRIIKAAQMANPGAYLEPAMESTCDWATAPYSSRAPTEAPNSLAWVNEECAYMHTKTTSGAVVPTKTSGAAAPAQQDADPAGSDYAMNSYPPEGRAWINEEKLYSATKTTRR